MELEVYREAEPRDSVVRLRLKPGGGCVTVEAVDENGRRVPAGNLLTFQADGTIHLVPGVNTGLGFQLDASGRIRPNPEF